MADHSLPTVSSTYANFVAQMSARFNDLAVGLDPAVTTATNVPTNAIRWSSAANTWQKWNGTAWVGWTSTLSVPGVIGAIGLVSVAGTTSSQPAVTVQAGSGATAGYNRARLNLVSQAGTAGWSILNYGDAGDLFAISTYGGGADKLLISQAGNVNITAASSGTTLNIGGGTTTGRLVELSGSMAIYESASRGSVTDLGWISSDFRIGPYMATGAGLLLQTTPSGGGVATRIQITSTGNVTINAPSSGDALTVNGNIAIGSPGGNIAGWSTAAAYTIGANPNATVTSGGFIQLYGSTNGTPSLVFIGTNNATRIALNQSGNVTIFAPGSGDALTVNGVTISGDITSTSGSRILGGRYSTGSITTLGSEYSSGGPVLGYGVWPSAAAAASFVSATTVNVARAAYLQTGNVHTWWSGGAQTVAIGSAVTMSELMRLDASGNLLVGGTTQYGSARLTLTGVGGYLALNTTTAGYTLVRGFDNGTERWSVGQIGFGGADGVAIYTGTANTERVRFTPAGVVFSRAAATTPVTVTFSATAMSVDCSASNVFTTTFTANVTTAPTISNPVDGQTINWFITQDATGSRTMTWPTTFKWPGGSAGVLSTTANAVDLLVATYRSATTAWYATLTKAFA